VQRLIQRHRWTAPRTAGLPGDILAPVGAATRSNEAAPCLTNPPPERLQRQAPAPRHSARAANACHPTTPSWGFCGSQTLLLVRRLYRFCHGSSAAFPPFL